MNWTPIPQGPWYNPKLEEGAYDAVIKNVHESVYSIQRDKYIQVVLWLSDEEAHFVSNFYLPSNKPDNRSIHRLYRLCKCVGRVPQDALDDPALFEGEELQVTVKQMKGVRGNGGRLYCDVDLFLPAGSVEPVSSGRV